MKDFGSMQFKMKIKNINEDKIKYLKTKVTKVYMFPERYICIFHHSRENGQGCIQHSLSANTSISMFMMDVKSLKR